ncbi:unnamed protein product [Prorocentrum cordatum]|uniref:EF-hand domain-containing protein n=1 Tax=Prorocentrum cordatum TaxID=2364126 RepID=A0ABN9VPW9_9DINO|nr:unnamed protein product [Polarella glacialis]
MVELEVAVPAPPRTPHPRTPSPERGDSQKLAPRCRSRNKIHADSASEARVAALDPLVDAVRSAVRAELQGCLGGPLREVVRTELAAALQGWRSHSDGEAALGQASPSTVGGPPAGGGGCGSVAPPAGGGAELPTAESRVSILTQTSVSDSAAQGSPADALARAEGTDFLKRATLLRRIESSYSLRTASDGGDNGLLSKFSQRSRTLSESLRRRHSWWLDEEPPRSGRLASYVDGPGFKLFLGAVVLVNLGFMVQDADVRIRSPADHSMLAADVVFLVIYFLEVVLKLAVHGVWFFIGADWKVNLLDMTVVISDCATVVLGTTLKLRFLKLAKVVKVFELMYHLKYLQAFLVCIQGSFSSFMWSVVMLFSVYGVFALLFMQVITSHIDARGETLDDTAFGEYFGSVGHSITTLFMVTTGGDDWVSAYEVIEETGPVGRFLFLAFIAFVNLNLLNIILGIFVDSAMKVLSPDSETLAHEYVRRDHEYAAKLTNLCRAVDTDCSGRLTQEQFKLGLNKKRIPHLLVMLGLKKHHILEFFESLAKASDHDGQVDIDTFVEGCMLFKGASTNFDLHKLRVESKLAHDKIIQLLQDITVTGGRQHSSSSVGPRGVSLNYP